MRNSLAESIESPARALFAAAALCLAAAGAAATEEASEALRERFREAYFAAATGAELGSADDTAELRAYPLYAYLEGARIGKALSLVDASERTERDAAAEAFLARHAGQPVADVLARDWLASLARRGRAAELVERYRPDLATVQLECAWLNARIETGAIEGLAPAILERWLTPRQLPIECEPAFEWLRAEGILDAAQTERRVRTLLENGEAAFARIIARRLPDERARPWLRWADLVTSPRAALDRLIADPSRAAGFEAVLDGFSRLARTEPAAALARLEPLVASLELGARETSLLTRALAYGLAWDRDRRALEYFERVAAEHNDDYTLAWRARAALWSGDWARVEGSIAAMSADARDEPAWTYWAARAAEQLGDSARARSLYESVVVDDNFYAALAATRLDRRVVPHQRRFASDENVIESLERQEAMVRARELRGVELPNEALAEWRHAQSRLDAHEQRQSIHVAAGWGWYDVAIATATSHEIFFDYRLLYPRPYDSAVASAARLTRLDEPLIYGVMRQESLYRADAASPAGAVGLMQLVPATARRAAESWGRPRPARAELFEPETNLSLGAAHLRDLVERFDGQLPVALAAYNAGPAAAARWLPETPQPIDVWIENVPYNETRAYVRRVMWHSLVFKWLAERRPQDAGTWLGRVSRPEAGSG